MKVLKFKSIDELIDERGLAIQEGIVDGYQVDPSTQEYLYEAQTSLVKGFGLPTGFVLVKPPAEVEEGAILRFVNGEWIQDKEMFEERRIAIFNEQRKQLLEQLNTQILQLERKKSVNRASEKELGLLTKCTNLMFDIEELDPTDPTVTLPVL